MRSLQGKTSLCVVLLMVFLTGIVQAAFEWTDAGDDHFWNTAANWNNGVPDGSSWCFVDMLPGAIVAADTVKFDNLHIGRYNGNEGAVTVQSGAALKAYNWLTLSRGADATLTVNGGTVGVPDDDPDANLLLIVGHEGGFNATLNMNGGLILTQRDFKIGNNAGSSGHVNLHGGTIDCDGFDMDEDAASHTMDVTYGTLIVDGDQVSYIQGFIDSGDITAFGGLSSTFELDYDVRNPGQTTLTAVSPLNPSPSNGANLSAGPVTLSWTLDNFEPNEPGGTISCDVFFGTDPNSLSPDFDFDQIVFDSTQESVEVTVDALEDYFWQVIVYDDSEGPDPIFTSALFTFNTNNVAPEVDAGDDIFTWLAGGSAVVALDGTVTDDGLPTGSYTVEWTDVSDPNNAPVVIDDATSEDTTATLTAAGTYVLQLEADDGDLTGSDTVTIEVYEDACAAAQADPEYTPIDGDINSDCVVNLEDFGILAGNWLLDNSLSN